MIRRTVGLFGNSSRFALAAGALALTAGFALLPLFLRTHPAVATGGTNATITFSAGMPAPSPNR